MVKKSRIVAALAILLIAAAGVITFEACNKKNEVVNNTKNKNIVTISSNDDMDGYLLDLRKRMKSATKDGEAMSLSDAEWALTALENFGLCDGSKRSTDMIVDTVFTKIMINDGNISLYELNLAYENSKRQIINKFNSLDGNDKNIYFIKSTIDDSSKNGTAEIRTIISMRNGGSMPNPMRFGPTDYWYDFNEKGKCGPYEGQCVGRDATIEMNSKVLTNLPQYGCEHGRVYFTDIDYHGITSWDYYGSCPDSPYEGCCLYFNDYNYNRCLSPSDLNWYLDKILECMDYWVSYYNWVSHCNKYMINFKLKSGEWTGFKASVPDFWEIAFDLGNIHCTHQPMDD